MFGVRTTRPVKRKKVRKRGTAAKRKAPAPTAEKEMILTPLAGSRCLLGEQREGSKRPSPSPSPSRLSQQQLNVPRLDLHALDQERRKQPSTRSPRTSFSSSDESRKAGAGLHDAVPVSGDLLLKSESASMELKEERQELERKRDVTTWTSRLRLVVPHVLLATVVILYTTIGAAVFHTIERSNEAEHKMQIVEKVRQLRDEYLDRMWNLSQENAIGDKEFLEQGVLELETVLRETMRAFEEGVTDDALNSQSLELMWTYSEAVLFSATVITTIGYGNLVPKTFWGRLFCIIYALLGIPLTLVTIADIGKFVGSLITWTYEQVILAKDTAVNGCQIFLRRLHPGRRKSRQQNLITSRGPSSRYRSSARRSSLADSRSHQTRRPSTTGELKQNNVNAKTLEDVAEETRSDEEPIKQRDVKGNKSERKQSEADDLEDEEEEEEETENDIPVPPSFILLIVVGYTALCSLLFADWEDWLYLDAFYFCLITVTTVGFGDLVPSEQSNAVVVLVFIFFGLVLATMCIDMVGTHYISKIHYMGRKLKDAKAALALIGGKAVNITAWTKQIKLMQHQYGMTDDQLRRLMENPEEYMQLMEAARLGMGSRLSLRAYIPRDAARMKYIDQNGGTVSEYTPTTPSQVAELLAFSTGRSSLLTQTTLSNMPASA